jgi:hypothetical protein
VWELSGAGYIVCLAMDEHTHRIVAGLITKVGARTAAQEAALSSALAQHCWPAAGTDRREPVAAEWLRRWSPRPGAVPARTCSCAVGRCGVCN